MHEAKVAIIDDNKDWRWLARLSLGLEGHIVVDEARTRLEAFSLVGKVASGELDVDVWLLDGALSRHSKLGEDAQIISNYIKTHEAAGHIIGFSTAPLSRDACDSFANKEIWTAIDIINSLPEKPLA